MLSSTPATTKAIFLIVYHSYCWRHNKIWLIDIQKSIWKQSENFLLGSWPKATMQATREETSSMHLASSWPWHARQDMTMGKIKWHGGISNWFLIKLEAFSIEGIHVGYHKFGQNLGEGRSWALEGWKGPITVILLTSHIIKLSYKNLCLYP